jgi:hypothetical protein
MAYSAEREALLDAPKDRPIHSSDVALDEALLPLMHTRPGIAWPALLDAVQAKEELPDASLLQWLSEALHYQIVEEDPSKPGTWRLTDAGEHRLKEVAERSADAAL